MQSSMIKTEAEAKAQWECPVARIRPNTAKHCIGDSCPVWRWMPVLMGPEHVKANKACMERGMNQKDASAYVRDNPSEFDLPTGPFEGYCGLGGEVLA